MPLPTWPRPAGSKFDWLRTAEGEWKTTAVLVYGEIMDRHQATAIAERVVAQTGEACGMKFVLLSQHTAAVPDGWLFFYQSEVYVQTGDFLQMLAGNGPVYVQRDGTVRKLTTSKPWQDQIQR